MSVREYHAYQTEVWPTVTAAFARLRAANDLIVIEGAGSPAEINLRDHDIVNMKMALHADCPVLLVGDIDRGGVFASLVGHMELFTAAERALIKGFIINKFRGDASLLDSGLAFLRERTGVPTLGVCRCWPTGAETKRTRWVSTIVFAGPDHRRRCRSPSCACPSSATTPTSMLWPTSPTSTCATRTTPAELAGAAAVVLPGTKSTVADLAWLRDSGLGAAVVAAARDGTPVVGICGGYQMLGRASSTPIT